MTARLILIGVACLALLGLVYMIYKHGYRSCELDKAKAVAIKDAEIATLRDEHEKQLAVLRGTLNTERRVADERIRKLLEENANLQAWWATPVPADAADYAWGLRERAGDRTLSIRPYAAPGITATRAPGEANRWRFSHQPSEYGGLHYVGQREEIPPA